MKRLHRSGLVAGFAFLLGWGMSLAGSADGAAGSAGERVVDAPAEEAFLNAGELLELCLSEKGSAGESQCLEFILGLAQTVAAMNQQDPAVRYFCIDPQSTAIQVVQRVLVQGLEARTAEATRPAFEVAIEVLGREWPCMSFGSL